MYITIDIGGTNLRLSSFSELNPNSFIKKIVYKSSNMQNYNFALKRITTAINILSESNSINGIGISMTGSVNPIEGKLVSADAFPFWENRNIVKDLVKEFDCKVKIDNDVVVAGLADKLFSQNSKLKRMAFIIMGTGLGGAKFQEYEDKILVFPMELGHIILEQNGKECICGQRGCLEVYASGKGLLSLYNDSAENLCNRKIWQEVEQHLAQGIVNLQNINEVDFIAFGGGLITKRPEILNGVRKLLPDLYRSGTAPTIELSKFGDNCGSVGGLGLLREDINLVNMNHL